MCFCASFCLLSFHLCPDAPPNFHCVVTRATIRRKRESHIFLFDKSTYVVFQWWSYLIYHTAGVQTVFPEFLVYLTLYKILCRFRLWSRQGCLKKTYDRCWAVLESVRCIRFVSFHVYADTAHMDWLPPAKCVNEPKFSSNGISIVADMCGMAECVVWTPKWVGPPRIVGASGW